MAFDMNEFLNLVGERMQDTKERYGQALFNVLSIMLLFEERIKTRSIRQTTNRKKLRNGWKSKANIQLYVSFYIIRRKYFQMRALLVKFLNART